MIHLIVGNTGSGKTTYANQLKEKTTSVVFSIDRWNKTLFLPDKQATDGLEWLLERIDRAEAIILDLIPQLERAKTDSILDLGFSRVEHRNKFKAFARANNFDVKIHFLNVSKELREERILKRNQEQGLSFEFEVTQEDFEFMETWFQKPSAEEMMGGVLISPTTDTHS